QASFGFLQDADDLFFGESLFHCRSSLERTLHRHRTKRGGQVSRSRRDFLSQQFCTVSPELGAGRIHQQIQSIAVGKFGRLVACFRLSDLDVGEWHGKKTGIVVGRSKLPPLCTRFLLRSPRFPPTVSER
ncbi:hypothetical protein, partial [Burkholderia ambifaria]